MTDVTADRPASRATLTFPPDPAPRVLVGAVVTGALLALAFAAPALLGATHGAGISSERRLERALVQAFDGITLPIVAAAIVAMLLSTGSVVRARADALVAAGMPAGRAVLRPLLLAVACAAVASALVGAAVVVVLRVRHHLGPGSLVIGDALGTAWAMTLGAAAWTTLAAALVVRNGRGSNGYLIVLLDLGARLLPGGAAWLAPSAHVANLLGAPPPAGLVHAPVLPQWVSVVVLAGFALLGGAATVRRYVGRP